MKLSRTITIVTANLGRGATVSEFKENVDRLAANRPGKKVFYGFQEIDEADRPEEAAYLRKVFAKTHRFTGTKTGVPIAVPRSFELARRNVIRASDGIPEVGPHREIVQAVVHPEDKPDRRLTIDNTHFHRAIAAAGQARLQAHRVLQETLKDGAAHLLTGDLNSHNYPTLRFPEKRYVTARLDYIRGYPTDEVEMRLFTTGTIDLTIDSHNAHWAKVQITWL